MDRAGRGFLLEAEQPEAGKGRNFLKMQKVLFWGIFPLERALFLRLFAEEELDALNAAPFYGTISCKNVNCGRMIREEKQC